MKNKMVSLRNLLLLGAIASMAIGISSCNKDSVKVSAPYFQAGQAISDATTGGALKGTMLAGKTYRISQDIIVNKGDTLVIQPGVKLYFGATPAGSNAISMIV